MYYFIYYNIYLDFFSIINYNCRFCYKYFEESSKELYYWIIILSGPLIEIFYIIYFIIFYIICFCFFIIIICFTKRESKSYTSHRYTNISFSNLNFDTNSKSNLISKNNEINIPQDNRKESPIIQTHSKYCDIEIIDNELYLVNKEEINTSFILYQSLKYFSNNIIIYIFNIAQVNLLKERFKSEPKIKLILLDKCYTNIEKADYIIINYIDSPISEESKKKFPSFESKINSIKYYNEKFFNILKNNAKLRLYIIGNDDYLKKMKVLL